METEERLKKLENEVEYLKSSIGPTLSELKDQLVAVEAPSNGAYLRRKVWIISLLSILLAIVLFANIRFHSLDTVPPDLDPTLALWLHAFWDALALVWLLLQLYPMALLVEEEQPELRGLPLLKAVRVLFSAPDVTVVLTLLVLGGVVISVFIPALWFIVVMGLIGLTIYRVVREA